MDFGFISNKYDCSDCFQLDYNQTEFRLVHSKNGNSRWNHIPFNLSDWFSFKYEKTYFRSVQNKNSRCLLSYQCEKNLKSIEWKNP